jgi:hypothetical protein
VPLFSVPRMVEASRRFGLTVEVVPGAESRGSAAFNPWGFVGHHTGGAKTGDRPSLNLCVNGRSDLDGPLCNDFLTRAGVNVIVAAGRANHAGLGGFRGLVGNSAVWGCEAEDDGDGSWTEAQIDAYPRLVAARLWLIGRDASWYCSHRTWAMTPPSTPGRKVDPAGIEDAWMQAQVAPLLRAGGAAGRDDDMPLNDADLKAVRALVRAEVDASVAFIVPRALGMVFTETANRVYGPDDAKGWQGIGMPSLLRPILTELAASKAREAALLTAVQSLGAAQTAQVDYARLQTMIDAAAAKAVDGIDLDVVRVDHTTPPKSA